jgi:signal peptidase I
MSKANTKAAGDPESGPRKSSTREYTEAIITAIILALIVRTFVVQAFKIPSGSMIPTLIVGDHILVNKFRYDIKFPFLHKPLFKLSDKQRGDVVVFIFPVDPSKDFIKRIIGLPGDRIRIIDKKLYVNDKPVPDVHAVHFDNKTITEGQRDHFGPVTVPENSYFVMGDNRDQSWDSRVWGFVKDEAIRGKAFLIYGCWNLSELEVKFSRFFKMIK